MCRIVVFAKPDNDSPDPVLNAKKYKRGMVVDIREDGQEVGSDIEKGDWWRVIERPGEPASDYAHLLGPDPEFTDEVNFRQRSQFPRKRVNGIDLDAVEAATGLKPGEKPEQAITLTKAGLAAWTVARAKLDNPLVIGRSTVVPEIG